MPLRWTIAEADVGGVAEAVGAALAASGLTSANVAQIQAVVDGVEPDLVRGELAEVFPAGLPPCHLVRQGLIRRHKVAALLWLYPDRVVRSRGMATVGSGPARLHFVDVAGSGHHDGDVAGDAGLVGDQWRRCFERLAGVLESGGLGMADLVKLWTYYSRVAGDTHFAGFSACRNELFGTIPFRAGLPASTGISTREDESFLGAIAATGATAQAVTSPLQADPQHYRPPMNPALFSRGVVVRLDDRALLLSSGTASVVGSTIAHEGDAGAQAGQVLDLLDALAGAAGQTVGDRRGVRYGYFIAYVRNPDDAATVLAVLRERQPGVPTLPVYAELSRPTLLVELDSAAYLGDTP